MKMTKMTALMAPIVLIAGVISHSSPAMAAVSARPASGRTTAVTDRQANISKILLVFENGAGGHTLPERARDKLFTLGDRELRLIASLCDRIAGDTAGANIAFLLITALIIFS